jgi:CheY-like chemotaxis protein
MATAKARTFKPDIVFCDIGLPAEMDGYQVAEQVRADSELTGLTHIALTGYARPEDIAKAKQSGFDSHLAKPPTAESLEKTLREV